MESPFILSALILIAFFSPLRFSFTPLNRRNRDDGARLRPQVKRSTSVSGSYDAPDTEKTYAGGPAEGTPWSFTVHDHMLQVIANARLDELARDKVWLFCTMVLPLCERVRPDRRSGR
jgi:hypothetical protein